MWCELEKNFGRSIVAVECTPDGRPRHRGRGVHGNWKLDPARILVSMTSENTNHF